MKSKITILFSFLSFFILSNLSAQVPKNVIVEHFTNTRCGICGFKNPSFYENLNSQEGILHLSIHPSAPYSSCVLSQHNPTENDARTNFYGVYGGTPRFVIQGDVQPGNFDHDNPDVWISYLNQTTPVSIEIEQEKSADLIKAKITLTTETAHTLGTLNLFIALAEDTIFYNAPNGEDLHFDVFRLALPNVDGMAVELPEMVGESVSFDVEIAPHADWDIDRIFTVAILQEDSKEVVQSAAVSPDLNMTISNVRDIPTLENVEIFPNPTVDLVTIKLSDFENSSVRVFNILGNLILENTFTNQIEIDLSDFSAGAYFLEVQNEKGRFLEKVVKY